MTNYQFTEYFENEVMRKRSYYNAFSGWRFRP